MYFKLMMLFTLINYSFAAPNFYNLNLRVSINGKYISSPKLTVKEGEKATIIQKTNTMENFVEVVTTDKIIKNQKAILMKFVVGMINKNGKRQIISKPQILAKENEPTQLSINSKEFSPSELLLSVTAKRKVL